jgi:hypothetical protein
MKRFSSLLLVAVMAFGLTLVGCDSGSSSTEGSMDVTMTESSSSSTTASKSTSKSHIGNVSEALVTFTTIKAVPATKDDSDADPIVLSEDDLSVDLMKLNDGIDESFTDISIPTGDYEKIRLVSGPEAVSLTFDDGSTNTARIASDVIRLNFEENPFSIDSADDRVEVTVEWTVEESLEGQQAGTDLKANNLVITPVVQATANVTSATSDDDSN